MVGDFNMHVEDESDFYGMEFCDVLSSFGLVNHVTVPTHELGHTLDLIITRNNNEIALTLPRAGYFISDHCFISTKLGIPRPNLQVKTVSSRKLKDIDMSEFKADIQNVCSELLHIQDINLLAHEYNVQLLQCLDRHAPVITRTQVVRPKVPYYDSSVKDLKRARRKAENEWRRNKTDSNLESKFKQARNKCAAKLDYLKTNHFSDAIHEANGDQKRLFSIIQSLTCVNRDNPLPDHVSIQQLANDFANFFIKKIEKIRNEIDVQDIDPPVLPSGPDCQEFSSFNLLSESDVKKLVTESNTTSCELTDTSFETMHRHHPTCSYQNDKHVITNRCFP